MSSINTTSKETLRPATRNSRYYRTYSDTKPRSLQNIGTGLTMQTTGEVLKFSGPWAKVTSCGDRVEDTPGSVTTRERPSVSTPIDRDPLLLQGEEYYESGNGDGTRERGRGDAKSERAVRESG